MNGFDLPLINTSALADSIAAINVDAPTRHMWADEQFEILKRYIQKFERSLDAEHEVGIMMTNFGQSILMQVTEIICEYPVLMVFKGFVN